MVHRKHKGGDPSALPCVIVIERNLTYGRPGGKENFTKDENMMNSRFDSSGVLPWPFGTPSHRVSAL